LSQKEKPHPSHDGCGSTKIQFHGSWFAGQFFLSFSGSSIFSHSYVLAPLFSRAGGYFFCRRRPLVVFFTRPHFSHPPWVPVSLFTQQWGHFVAVSFFIQYSTTTEFVKLFCILNNKMLKYGLK